MYIIHLLTIYNALRSSDGGELKNWQTVYDTFHDSTKCTSLIIKKQCNYGRLNGSSFSHARVSTLCIFALKIPDLRPNITALYSM